MNDNLQRVFPHWQPEYQMERGFKMIGRFPTISNEAYHAAPGISKSALDKINISPLEYWDTYINPDKPIRKDAGHFLFGTGMHSCILEPDLFRETYASGFDKSRYPGALDTMDEMRAELQSRGLKTTGSKRELTDRLLFDGYPDNKIMACLEEDYGQQHGSKIGIKAEDYINILGTLEAMNKHHTASKLLKNCLAEQSYFVYDEYGFIRKCRPDFITANGRVVCDLKSTTDVSASGFGRSVVKFRYLIQAAWYLDVLKLHYGDAAPTTFAFIAIQRNRPHDVVVYYVTEDQIALGRELYMQDYATLRLCTEKNTWPGFDGGRMLQIELPKWA